MSVLSVAKGTLRTSGPLGHWFGHRAAAFYYQFLRQPVIWEKSWRQPLGRYDSGMGGFFATHRSWKF